MGFWGGMLMGSIWEGAGLFLFIIVILGILYFIEAYVVPITLLYIGGQLIVRFWLWIKKQDNRNKVRIALDHMKQVIRKGDYSGQWYRYVCRIRKEK